MHLLPSGFRTSRPAEGASTFSHALDVATDGCEFTASAQDERLSNHMMCCALLATPRDSTPGFLRDTSPSRNCSTAIPTAAGFRCSSPAEVAGDLSHALRNVQFSQRVPNNADSESWTAGKRAARCAVLAAPGDCAVGFLERVLLAELHCPWPLLQHACAVAQLHALHARSPTRTSLLAGFGCEGWATVLALLLLSCALALACSWAGVGDDSSTCWVCKRMAARRLRPAICEPATCMSEGLWWLLLAYP